MATASLNAIKRERTRRLARLIAKSYFLQQRKKEEELYTLICNEFVDLGGVYVKFLQGVLLNSRIMRKWQTNDRLKIFENLETVELDIVAYLQSELTDEQLKEIELVQPKPFAAGSFGQVYYGQHRNGQAIVIKVLRPQIRELLRYDLKLLTIFSRLFISRQYKSMNLNLSGAVRDFKRATLRESDYIAEARFADEMYQRYLHDEHIVIPQTYTQLCNKHIIVQDYLAGLSVVDVMRAKQDGADPVAFVREKTGSDLDTQLIAFGSRLMSGALTLPRIQGDPHPGNLRLLPDNKVGMIDFGISANAPRNQPAFFQVIDEWKKIYTSAGDDVDIVSLFDSLLRFFVNDLYTALKKLSGRNQSFSEQTSAPLAAGGLPNNLVIEVGKLVKNMLQGAIGTQDVRRIMQDGRSLDLFNNVINKGNRLGFRLHIESSEILRAIQTYMALVIVLGRREQVFAKMFSDGVANIEHSIPNIRYQEDDAMSMNQAFETIHSWLERVANNDPELFRQLIQKMRRIQTDITPIEEQRHA